MKKDEKDVISLHLFIVLNQRVESNRTSSLQKNPRKSETA